MNENLNKNENIGSDFTNNYSSNPSKKKYNSLIIIILIVVILFIIGKFGLNYFYSHDSNATVSSEVKFADDLQKITVSSIDIYIPSNINVKTESNYYTMEDSKHEYVVRVDVENADFQYLLDNHLHLRADENAPYNSKAVIKKFDGKEYIVVENAKRFSKTLTAFTKATDNKILVISIINKKNTYDYALLEKFSEIINDVSENN